MDVLELWEQLGRSSEFEVTALVSESDVPRPGEERDVPGLGQSNVINVRRLRAGGREVPPGQVVVRMDVSVQPGR